MSLTLNKVNFEDAVNFDIRDLSHSQDSIKVGDGTDFLAIAADGSIAVTDNGGSLTVDAVNLDIRDLTHVSDSVKIGDGTDFLAIAADGSIGVTDNGGSLTVDATDLDIRNLTHASDTVRLGDGTDLTDVTSGALHVRLTATDVSIDVQEEANTAIQSTQSDVTTTSGALLGSQLANRKYLYVQNRGGSSIFVGMSGVTTADGIEVFKNNTMDLRLGPALSLHAVTASGTQDARIMELA